MWNIPAIEVKIPASTCQKITVVSMGNISRFIYVTIKIPVRATKSEAKIRKIFQNNLRVPSLIVPSDCRK